MDKNKTSPGFFTTAGTGLQKGLGGAANLATRIMTSGPVLGLGAAHLIGKVGRVLQRRTNPPSIAYGKRGLDANNLSTDGLALSLHRNRRSTK